MADFAGYATMNKELRKEPGKSKDDIPCNHVHGDRRRVVKRKKLQPEDERGRPFVLNKDPGPAHCNNKERGRRSNRLPPLTCNLFFFVSY